MNLTPDPFELMEASVKSLSARLPQAPELCLLVVRVLQQVARGLGEMLEQQLRPFGLAEAEFRVLVTLFAQPQGVGHASELCARTSQRPANMSRICDALVERDLITRISCADDRRRMVLRVTARGEELVQRLLPLLFASLRELFAVLPESERQQLLTLLKRLGGQLESGTQRPGVEHFP